MITQASFAGWAVTGGTSMTMARVLAAVESRLLAEQQAEGDTGSLAEWIGLDEPVRSVRGPGQGNHSNGNAVDINYNTAPYIATRSGATYGGEKSTLPEAGGRCAGDAGACGAVLRQRGRIRRLGNHTGRPECSPE